MNARAIPTGAVITLVLGALSAALAIATRQSPDATAPQPVKIVTTASFAVSFARDQAKVIAGQPVALTIAAHSLVGDQPVGVTAEAFPGLDGQSNPLAIELRAVGRNRAAASVTFPAVGLWELDVDAAIAGTSPERAIFEVPVTAQNALPPSVAWGIAVLPLLALACFARAEMLRLRTLPSETVAARPPLPRG